MSYCVVSVKNVVSKCQKFILKTNDQQCILQFTTIKAHNSHLTYNNHHYDRQLRSEKLRSLMFLKILL
jgi:hypothetical protein